MSTDKEWQQFLEHINSRCPSYSFLPHSAQHIKVVDSSNREEILDLGPWYTNPELAASRAVHLLGKSQPHHARKLIFRKLEKLEAVDFFKKTHPFGYRKSRWHGGLFHSKDSDHCIMAASFAQIRVWNRSAGPYRSAELILMSTRNFEYVQGGASKLIAAYCEDKTPDEIITRAPEQSIFEKLGFFKEVSADGRMKWRKTQLQ